MLRVKVILNDIDRVKEFVHIMEMSRIPCEIGENDYFTDAKSIIGIFSLDTKKALTLVINSEDENETAELIEKIEKFIIK